MKRVLQRLGAVQIDAVNVLVRAHYLPFFSRLGPYDVGLLDRLTYQRGEAFEYDAHAASIVDGSLHADLRWRMEAHAANKHWRAMHERVQRDRPGYVDDVIGQVRDRGPLAFNDLAEPGRRKNVQTKYAESTILWGVWSDGKSVLESLFHDGRLAVAGRRGFERLYDLPERVLAPAVLDAPTPDAADAQRNLVRRAAAALGVATVRDLADYFRLPMAVTKARVNELVEGAQLKPVAVEGSGEPHFLAAAAAASRPKPVEAAALLGPFDSLLWERSRNRRLLAFEHSFEIYVPAAKRKYGYYVCPFLLGERLVARVDLKADRKNGRLLVQSLHCEPGVKRSAVIDPLNAELTQMAKWLGVEPPPARSLPRP